MATVLKVTDRQCKVKSLSTCEFLYNNTCGYRKKFSSRFSNIQCIHTFWDKFAEYSLIPYRIDGKHFNYKVLKSVHIDVFPVQEKQRFIIRDEHLIFELKNRKVIRYGGGGVFYVNYHNFSWFFCQFLT